jgi:hypothetical protein
MNPNDLFPMELAPYRAFLGKKDQSWDNVGLLLAMRELYCALPLGISASAVSIQCQSQQVGFLEWVGVSTRLRDHTEVAVLLAGTGDNLSGCPPLISSLCGLRPLS